MEPAAGIQDLISLDAAGMEYMNNGKKRRENAEGRGERWCFVAYGLTSS